MFQFANLPEDALDLQVLKLVIELGSFGVIAWIVMFWLPKAFGSLERLSASFIADSKAQREESRADMAAARAEFRVELREERDRFIRAIDDLQTKFTAALSEHTEELRKLGEKIN